MTTAHRTGCLICGRDLEYLDSAREMTCSLCGERTMADVRCAAGHYICDR
jgi:DNA-directed RNA polymerase subunit RPC12/RpoP